MNLSELDFHLADADVDGVVARLRALSIEHGWHLTLREREINEPVTYIWGRMMVGAEDWAEAEEEVAAGLGSLVEVAMPDGTGHQVRRSAFIYESPYREQLIAALANNGKPVFDWTTHIVELEISWSLEAPSLKLGLDRRTRHSVELGGQRGDTQFLFTAHSWVLPVGGAGISEHLTAVSILDALRDLATITVYDTTGFTEHRDDTLAIAVAVDRQQQLRSLRNQIGLS